MVGKIGVALSGFRTNKHNELPTFHLGFLNDHTVFAKGIGDFVQRVEANGLSIDNFSSSKAHRHLDLVFFGQELLDFPDFKIKVMLFSFGPKLDFSGLDDGLLLFGFLLFLFQLITEFVEVHDPTHGWIRFVGDLDQIKTLFLRCFQGSLCADNTALRPIGINEPDLAVIDVLVDFNFQILLCGRFSRASFFNVRSSSYCLTFTQCDGCTPR
jgi:hypothetical protein